MVDNLIVILGQFYYFVGVELKLAVLCKFAGSPKRVVDGRSKWSIFRHKMHYRIAGFCI